MKKRSFVTIFCVVCALLVIAGVAAISSGSSDNPHGTPQLDDRYELIAPIYIVGAYNSLNNKSISKRAAKAYLNPKRYVERNHHAFNELVPAGTIMTIASIEPDKFVLDWPQWVTKRIVGLSPDPSRGLDIILTLDRGMEGELDGLNSSLFRKLPPAHEGPITGTTDKTAGSAPHGGD